MEVQPSIKQFFKSRKRPVSVLQKDSQDVDKPSKVFLADSSEQMVSERIVKKVVYQSSFQSVYKSKSETKEELNKHSSEETIQEKESSSNIVADDIKSNCIVNKDEATTVLEVPVPESSKNNNEHERPCTPENFISVEKPTTPSIRNSVPTTPSYKNVNLERPSTPESNPEALNVIQQSSHSGINDIKKKWKVQKKLQAVQKSLERINVHSSRLEAIQNALRANDVHIPKDEPISPRKTPVRQRLLFPKEKTFSPVKNYVSPRKLLLDGPVPISTSPIKEPAYKRFADLTAIQEKGTLNLPYKYRMLAEIFRAVDTIVSMIHTRGENVTFEKLQAGVQSMMRKNLNHDHLGQIKTILPDSYEYTLEKCQQRFGNNLKEKYELIIKPILKSSSDSSHCSMNSALLLNRRRAFHGKLLDLTKNYHEEFLLSRVPPVIIDKTKLTRWHPEFELDKVPDIPAQDVPIPNKTVQNTSAKQLLERAKTLLSCNKRLELAMEQIKAKKEAAAPTTDSIDTITKSPQVIDTNKETPKVNNSPVPPPATGESSAISAAPALQKAIKGIPKALLEKIRARQAAKAMESMTQSPSDIKEAIMMSRLPEIARILRVLFVAEKRSILPLDLVIKRISHSFREHLSNGEIKSHLDLLTKHVGDWVKFTNLRNTDFVKLAKDKELNTVVTTLETLAKNKDKSV